MVKSGFTNGSNRNGWVIESSTSTDETPEYWGPTENNLSTPWVSDINQAIRFKRQDDAERMSVWIEWKLNG